MSEAQYYDGIYSRYASGETVCGNSAHDLGKARTRVQRVIRYFNLDIAPDARALDAGCGLGYYSEALHHAGFRVTGVDISRVAVECAGQRFGGPEFRVSCFPEETDAKYDLIWTMDISPLNTFDMAAIGSFIDAALRCLNPGGVLVTGWHTDFSGQMIPNENWAGWDMNLMKQLAVRWNMEGPAIVESRNPVLNFLAIRLCRMLRKSAPVFLVAHR